MRLPGKQNRALLSHEEALAGVKKWGIRQEVEILKRGGIVYEVSVQR